MKFFNAIKLCIKLAIETDKVYAKFESNFFQKKKLLEIISDIIMKQYNYSERLYWLKKNFIMKKLKILN